MRKIFTWTEMYWYGVLMRAGIMSMNDHSKDATDAGDIIILAAEKIKAERLSICTQATVNR